MPPGKPQIGISESIHPTTQGCHFPSICHPVLIRGEGQAQKSVCLNCYWILIVKGWLMITMYHEIFRRKICEPFILCVAVLNYWFFKSVLFSGTTWPKMCHRLQDPSWKKCNCSGKFVRAHWRHSVLGLIPCWDASHRHFWIVAIYVACGLLYTGLLPEALWVIPLEKEKMQIFCHRIFPNSSG